MTTLAPTATPIDVDDRSPFVGLRPFTQADARYFFGRERTAEIIAANLLASRLTVVYGPSGVGKSSVLRAGVTARVRAEAEAVAARRGRPDVAIVVFTEWRDEPVARLLDEVRIALQEQVGASADELVEQPTLTATLQAWTAQLSVELLVILDQFEEYFQYHPDADEPGSLGAELPHLVTDTDTDIDTHVLLAVREDALAGLDRFKGRIPNLFDNYLRLRPLDREAGRAAILRPVERYNEQVADAERVSVEDELVSTLLDQVRITVPTGPTADGSAEIGDLVEAAQLQLVMRRVWQEEADAGSYVLRWRTLDRLGAVVSVVRAHLDDTLAALSPDDQRVAAKVFHHLVTPSGTKIAHTAADLTQYAEEPEDDVARVLDQLTGYDRILRAVPPPLDHPTRKRYEIYHDLLARPVLDWRREEAERRRAEAQQRRQDELEHERAEAQQLAQRERRRKLAWQATTVVLVLAMVALGVLGYLVRRQAQVSAARAVALNAENLLDVDPADALRAVASAYRETPGVTVPEREWALRRALDASRVRVVMSGHAAPINSMDVSHDGAVLVTGDQDGIVRLWDAATGEQLGAPLTGHTGPVSAVTFSHDGDSVATSSWDNTDATVRVWDVETRRETAIDGAGADVRSVQFSPDDARILTAHNDGTARLWDARTGSEVPALGRRTGRTQSVVMRSAAFSRNGRHVVTAGEDGSVRVWDATSGRQLEKMTNHGAPVNKAVFSPDGTRVVSGGEDGRAFIWTWQGDEAPKPLEGHNSSVLTVEVSGDNRWVVTSGGSDARVWDLSSGHEQAVLSHNTWVYAAHFDRTGQLVVTASNDDTARVWDPANGANALMMTLRGHGGPVYDAQFGTDTGTVVTISSDQTARRWAPILGRELRERDAWIIRGDYAPDGETVATGDTNGRVITWTAESGRRRNQLANHPGQVRDLAYTPDGQHLIAVWSEDDQGRSVVRVLDLTDHDEEARLPIPAPTYELDVSPDGSTVAIGTNSEVLLWPWEHDEPVQTLAGHDDTVRAATFSPDGRRMVTGSFDGTVRLWDTTTAREIARLPDAALATDAVFSPDGTQIAVIVGNRVQLRDATQLRGNPTVLPAGTSTSLTTVAYSADGERLAAGTIDGKIMVWDLSGDHPVRVALMDRHADTVSTVRFNPYDAELLSTGEDGIAMLYRCATCDDVDSVLAQATRRLRYLRDAPPASHRGRPRDRVEPRSGNIPFVAGDCLSATPETAIGDMQAVPCDRRHGGEVVAVLAYPAGPNAAYDKDAVDNWSAAACAGDVWEAYVGAPHEQTDLDVWWYGPTAESWASGDRFVLCLAFGPDDAPLERSVRDIARPQA